MQSVDEANAAIRESIERRRANAAAGKSHDQWYDEPEGGRQRPGSLAFMEAVEEIKQTHIRKSQDYGDPTDPLANVKAGAELVGIEAWRGCVIRMADKMQRIKSYCREGKLANESFEDALLDLASYAVIALVLFREDQQA
jgi:hypothetical protein